MGTLHGVDDVAVVVVVDADDESCAARYGRGEDVGGEDEGCGVVRVDDDVDDVDPRLRAVKPSSVVAAVVVERNADLQPRKETRRCPFRLRSGTHGTLDGTLVGGRTRPRTRSSLQKAGENTSWLSTRDWVGGAIRGDVAVAIVVVGDDDGDDAG